MTPCSLRRFARRWRRFFFEPVDTLPCDVLRIGLAVLLLLQIATTWSRVVMWYGESGVLPYDLSRDVVDPQALTLFSLLPRTDAAAQIAYGLFAAQSLLLALGVWSRWQAVGVFIWLTSFQHRNVLILDAEDSVFRVLAFLLIFMPLGRHLAWDAWRRREPAQPAPCPALRLVQLEMCLIFAGAALSKLRSADWLDGYAMYYTSRLEDYFDRFPSPAVLWESMLLLKLTGWSVIAVEAAAPILIWFRETRLAVLVVVAGFHLACEYTMNLYLFHLVMLVGWSSFLSGDAWRRLARRRTSRPLAPPAPAEP